METSQVRQLIYTSLVKCSKYWFLIIFIGDTLYSVAVNDNTFNRLFPNVYTERSRLTSENID